MLMIGDEGGSGKCWPLLTRGVWKPPNLAGVICEQPLIKGSNKERENGVGLREEIHPESWLWLLQMEGNSNPITIYPKLDISHLYLSDPQEDKQFNADTIHPKEELVDWTQKLITCYITIPSIPMKDISSFHVCLVSEKFSKFANDDLSFSILRLAVAAEWGINKDRGFKIDAYMHAHVILCF